MIITPSANHINLGKQTRVLFSTFSDGERRVKIIDKQQKPIVIAGLQQPDRNILDVLLVLNALKKTHHLIITYCGYARQDNPASGEPNSAQLIADLMKVNTIGKISIVEMHTQRIKGLKYNNISTLPLFIPYVKKIRNPVVIAPDKGAQQRARQLAKKLHTKVIALEKHRPKPGVAIIKPKKMNLKNKTAIIWDDMIDTGGTIIKTAELLKRAGAVKIIACITHGLFSNNALKKLHSSPIDKILVSNTIPIKQKSKKLKIISIAPLLKKYVT